MYVICTKKTFLRRVMATYKPSKRPIQEKNLKKNFSVTKIVSNFGVE